MTHYHVQGVMSAQFSPVEMTTGKGTEISSDSPKNDLLSSITVFTTPRKFRREVAICNKCRYTQQSFWSEQWKLCTVTGK